MQLTVRARVVDVRNIRLPGYRRMNPRATANFRLVEGIARDATNMFVEGPDARNPCERSLPKLSSDYDRAPWRGRNTMLPYALRKPGTRYQHA